MLKIHREKKEKKTVKNLPMVAASGKTIAAEKKNAKIMDEDGNLVSMEEMLARSKKG